STRSEENSLETLFKNLKDIANTMSNWLRYTQLVEVHRNDTGDVISEITDDVVAEISDATGIDRSTVSSVLQMKFPRGASEAFLSNYLELSARSREKATEFELATAEIFRKIFGFKAEHTGNHGLRPDVVLSSTEAHYGAIIDNKAY
ncbi:restriction endonuclease FokI C-terminal domain-containing protein, partial [Brevibacterium paucivorans]